MSLRWRTGFVSGDDVGWFKLEGAENLRDTTDHVSDSTNRTGISLADVVAARERVRGAIYYSPCPHSQMLSALTGQQVYLKLENLQMTGSFKERGALNRIAMLTPEQAARGVVAASAGNHAQGVAYHATKRGIRALIVMPLATPLVKVTATRGFGAEVVLYGANYDEACEEATRLCAAEGMTFIHPFDDAVGDGRAGDDWAGAAGAGSAAGGGCGADWRRRADWRDRLRDQGVAA